WKRKWCTPPLADVRQLMAQELAGYRDTRMHNNRIAEGYCCGRATHAGEPAANLRDHSTAQNRHSSRNVLGQLPLRGVQSSQQRTNHGRSIRSMRPSLNTRNEIV